MTETRIERGSTRIEVFPDHGLLAIHLDRIRLRGRWQVSLRADEVTARQIAGSVESAHREPLLDEHGAGEKLVVRRAYASGLVVLLEAAVYDARPFAALRVGLINEGGRTVHVERMNSFISEGVEFGVGPLDGWVNGYHSWSFSGFVRHDRRQPRMITSLVTRPHAENTTTRHPSFAGQYVGEWVAALIEPRVQALVIGFIGLERQFGQVYLDGRPGRKSVVLENTADGVRLDPGHEMWGEWAVLYRVDLPHPDPLGIYAEAVTRLTPARGIAHPPTPGWSSWYQFFDAVTAQDMARNLEALSALRDRLPLPLFQLDDGYQPAWGDWLAHNEKFPAGVSGWAADVREAGFEPGLWLSPFTVEPAARIYKDHPEAVLRDRRGRPVHGGFLVKHWIKGLDPTHPATQDFVRETIDTIVHRWGIRYLKLDFLYCGALPGVRHDVRQTRAQALRGGLSLIREAAGDDVTILACGCPLGPAVGIADLMRVSPDVAPHWYPDLFGNRSLVRDDYSLPAARNSVTGSINRSWTHRRWWWLDADNLLVREAQELDAAEVQALTGVVALTNSHLIVSDDLPLASDERLRWAASLLPLFEGRPETIGLFSRTTPDLLVQRLDGPAGPWTLVGVANWEDQTVTRLLDVGTLDLPVDQTLLACEFWSRQIGRVDGLLETTIEPHGMRVFALRSPAEGPAYVGSDLHISMGAEVAGWAVATRRLRLTLDVGRRAEGHVWLRLPAPPVSAMCDGLPAPIAGTDQPDIYRLAVRLDGRGEIEIGW
ncbi:MAG: hypothetical protein Kow00124_05980 [Anaerolineae bacterium]